jgi:SAM-dependent methyltransferase
MENIDCIFGHGPSNQVVIEENGFQGRRCPVCSLIYISPRPERSEVLDLYHHDKAFLPATHHLQFNPAAELAAKKHFHAITDQNPTGRIPKNARYSMLEIGCGGGHLLKLAKDHGFDVYGVELNPYQAEHVRSDLGIPCETVPFSRESFGNRRFDIIFHCDVTSHLSDPIGDFSAMYDKLNDTGQIIFETGNGADIDPRFYRYIQAWQYPDHLFFFGESSIRELLKRAGFKSAELRSWSILPQLAVSRAVHSRKSKPGPKSPANSSVSLTGRLNWKTKIKRVMAARVTHFIRSLGALSSNSKAPRSMIVWATK